MKYNSPPCVTFKGLINKTSKQKVESSLIFWPDITDFMELRVQTSLN